MASVGRLDSMCVCGHLYDHRKVNCSVCGKRMNSASLANHLKRHDNNRQVEVEVQCDKCDEILKQENLKIHKERFCRNRVRSVAVKCEKCGKFFFKKSMKVHMKFHERNAEKRELVDVLSPEEELSGDVKPDLEAIGTVALKQEASVEFNENYAEFELKVSVHENGDIKYENEEL